MLFQRNTGLVFGLLCGVAMSCWVLLEFVLGFHTTSLEIGQYSGYFSILFPILFIYISLKEKQNSLNQQLPVFEAINIGFRIAFFSSLVLSCFFYIYNSYINPDWINAAIEWQRKKLITGGATDDEIGIFMEQNRAINNSLGQTVMGFISFVGQGVFITLLEIPIVRQFFRKHSPNDIQKTNP